MTPRFLVKALLVSLGVAVGAYLGAMLLPKKYASSMSLYFPAGQGKASNALASLAGGGAVGEGDAGSISSLGGAVSSPLVASGPPSATGILTSRTCLTEVVQKLGLKEKWSTSNELAAVERLRNSVSVNTDRNGFLIVQCTESDAELCQQIVQAMKVHLDRRAGELTLSLASSNRVLVEKQFEKATKEVDAARADMLEALENAGPGDVAESAKNLLAIKTKLVEVKSEAEAASQSIAVQEDALRRYYSGAKDANALENGIALGPSTAMSKLAEELQTSRIEMADISRKFTSNSPEFQLAQKRLNAAEATAREELGRQTERVKDGTSLRLLEAKSRLKSLNAAVDVYDDFLRRAERELSGLPEKTAAAAEAQANFDAALTARVRLKGELDRAILAELRDPSRYKVVDEPIADPSPVSPRKGIIAAIFFMLAAATQFLLLGTRGRPGE